MNSTPLCLSSRSTTGLTPPFPVCWNNHSFQIEITGIPAENAKCRVETQLKIGLCIKDAQGEIARQWKQFRLPRDLIAKEKHRLTKYNGKQDALVVWPLLLQHLTNH